MQAESPYKFLDYYEFNKENPEPFFGRQRETQILLSDILISRLVVLFAQTGTGKTSLINAGVRPLLEKRNYKHILIRVRDDAGESARAELQDYLRVETLEGETLADQLRWANKQLKRPLVLFFDQFEEFFLKKPTPENKQNAKQFVSDIAALYEDNDSGIHVVFSMREEWFIKMDLFREYIPELFQNESSLRLHFFRPEQAREAILGPATLCGVRMEDRLIEQLISDVANEDGEIEPAQLQIICDTLWRNKANDDEITEDDYRSLGRKYKPTRKRQHPNHSQPKISQQVLTGRLVEAFERLDTEPQLTLAARLLPELCTDQNTKSFRDLEGLAQGLEAKELKVSKEDLRSLLEYLKGCGLIRIFDRGDVAFVELAHDYLAHKLRLNDLRERIEAIWPRKLLDRAMKADKSYQAAHSRGSTRNRLKELADWREQQMSTENLKKISENVATGEYNAKDLKFLFRWALSRVVESYVLELWFREAKEDGVDVWQILRNAITGADVFSEEAQNAVRLLGRLQDGGIWNLLSTALNRKGLDSVAVEVLTDLPTAESARLLESALRHKDLVKDIIAAFGRMRTAQAVDILGKALRKRAFGELAAEELQRISKGRQDEIAIAAKSMVNNWSESIKMRSPETREQFPARAGVKHTPVTDTFESVRIDRQQSRALSETDWRMILDRIKRGRCTPIVGAGLIAGSLPLSSDVANHWAKLYDYPLDDPYDLTRVAQFIDIKYDSEFTRGRVQEIYGTVKPPDFSDPSEPHAVLARLPFDTYLTTNYDDFLTQALQRQNRKPVQSFCRWNRLFQDDPGFSEDFVPTIAEPLVFHLYGMVTRPESLVLSENDYLTFLANLSRDERIIVPIRVQKSLSSSSLLFMGYRAGEWGFQILNHVVGEYLRKSLTRAHLYQFSVPTSDPRERTVAIQKYFDEYFARALGAKTYWGTSKEFAIELMERWNNFAR